MLKNIIYFILLALLLPISAQAQVLKPVVKVSKAKLGNNYVYS